MHEKKITYSMFFDRKSGIFNMKFSVRRALDGDEAILANPHAEHFPAPCLPRFPHLEEI